MRVHLTDDELTEITGYARHADRVGWLASHGWVYTINGRGKIVVGRWYADHRLAGLRPGETATAGGINLDAVR